MTIDVIEENLISFRELAASLPSRRENRPIHISTLHRWRSRGVRGIKLEATRVGGAWCTSWEAFRRFCDRLTAIESQPEVAVTKPGNRSSHKAAEKALDADDW